MTFSLVADVWAWLPRPGWVRNLASVRAPFPGKASGAGAGINKPPVLGAEDTGEQCVVLSLTDGASCLRGPVLQFNMCVSDSTWGKDVPQLPWSLPACELPTRHPLEKTLLVCITPHLPGRLQASTQGLCEASHLRGNGPWSPFCFFLVLPLLAFEQNASLAFYG